MRPGQNKRMRGRNNNNNNRRGPNPLTRSYESNGPDVKIRGTAHHVGEKYLQLARDAQSSGDPVMAESYLQHAEHYFRLIAAAQLAQQQAQFGYQRPPGEQVEQDDDGDEDFDSLPDRFASPSERVAHVPPPQPQPYEPRNDRNYPDRQAYDGRNNDGRNNQAQNGHFNDRQQQGDRNEHRPRQPFGDRNFGQQDRGNQDRANQDRSNQDRNGQDRNGQDRGERYAQNQERQGGDRQNRDYDNRNFRNRRDDRTRDDRPRDDRPREASQPREYRDQPRDVRETRSPASEEQPSVGLPAFITAPTRAAPTEPASDIEPPTAAQPETPATAPEASDDAQFHMRPRRRRRPKPEFVEAEGAAGEVPPTPADEGAER